MNRTALRWALPLLMGFALTSCEDDTSPLIAKFKVSPECGVMTEHVEPIFDAAGNVIGQRDLGTFLEVSFFARASGGNEKPDPTGANTPLDWTWDFGDGTIVTNQVTGYHNYTTAGIYTVRLTVKDEDGDEDFTETTIVVGALGGDVDVLSVAAEVMGDPQPVWRAIRAQCPPPALPGVTRITGWTFVGYEYTFDGSLDTPCAVDGLTEQYTWRWNYGDGGPEDLHIGTPKHVYPALDATFDITLTVREMVSGTVRSAMVQVTTPATVPTEVPATTQCPVVP